MYFLLKLIELGNMLIAFRLGFLPGLGVSRVS